MMFKSTCSSQSTLLYYKRPGLLGKRLILGMEQPKYKKSLEHLAASEKVSKKNVHTTKDMEQKSRGFQ